MLWNTVLTKGTASYRRYSHNAPVFNWRLDMAVTVKLVRYKICVGGERNN